MKDKHTLNSTVFDAVGACYGDKYYLLNAPTEIPVHQCNSKKSYF